MSDAKIMPVTQINAVARCMASPASYAHDARGRGYSEPTKKQIAIFATARLEAARKLDMEDHEKNMPAIEANKAIRERVTALMEEIGMPVTRKVRDGNRTRYGIPKMKTIDAGYIEDLRVHVPIDDGFATATAIYHSLKAKYDAYADEAEKEAERAKAVAAEAEERRKAERRANLELAEIILRYDLDRDSEWSDVLDALRKRDQRLDLAVAMKQTRGDWSGGFYRVSDAIGRFKIETDEDKSIANEIVSLLHDDHDDGRVFRDCAWSYDRLFASASDRQLAADVQRAAANVRND